LRGWTLLELMVVLAVTGITMSMAIPSFQGMIARNRQVTEVNDFLVAVNTARSEAGKVGRTVSVQAVLPEGGADVNNEFGPGWCVVLGNPGDCAGEVISRFDGLVGEASMNSRDGENVSSLQFDALGGLANTNNATRSFDFCTEGQQGRRVFITLTGRSKSHKPNDPDANKQPAC
jgi:type IV fimbrial biogenesis protein FimT